MLDNLYVKNIKECIHPLMEKYHLSDAKQAADCLAKQSEKLGDDPSYYSPFAKSAAEEGINYMGGKSDDITVIVAQIKSKSEFKTEDL